MATNEPDSTPAENHGRQRSRRFAAAELAAAAPAVALRYGRLVSATVRNAAEVVRFGGLETGEQPAPFSVEAEQSNYRLRHYFADDAEAAEDATAPDGPPILLVPPLMMATEVWDVAPSTSAVVSLHDEGIDPWVVDFGDPGHEPGGLERTLSDHVLAVSDAVDRVHAATGRDVVLAGYSQGGMFAYQTAALRRGKNIDSLVTFGSPADTTAPLPIPISPDVAARLATGLVESGLLRKLALPKWATRVGFMLLSPAKAVQGRVQFLLALHDRDALLPRERQRRFLDSEGWTAYSGPAMAELLEQFVAHNRMLEGGFVIDDRLVTLADINVPIMTVLGTTDTIGHPDAVRAIRKAAPRAEVYELALPGGHFGLVVGSQATDVTWPAVAAWTRWRAAQAELPADIVPAGGAEASTLQPSAAASALAQATEIGIGATRILLGTARQAVRAARSVVSEAPAQLPRLARIEQLDPATRISLGLLLDEQARSAPDEICFLFGDRAYRQRDVKYRVDSVVKGLLSVGVRADDRVGVLMTTRPSAFTVVAALSRLGAIAVLLRPDGELEREAALGDITWLVSDPEHVRADGLDGVTWCVLGGGADERELHPHVVDMERIDPDAVELPAGHRTNPRRAADLAFVVFTGEGSGTKAVRITNRRWALSALGTASAAALRTGDTVYSTTPIHHSSALLMSVGGAVASGARFAIGTAEDPNTFWEEVRRYGATHVSYTWTSLHAITMGPPNLNEQHHPIRMFMGSGLPRNLWKRLVERFPTARVLEFYASAEGEVILANVKGNPVGSMGRPLPGSAQVRVAAFDRATRELERGADGLVRECRPDEVGLLLARINPGESSAGSPLRGVFAPGDVWRSTGDLFLRDEHHDLWLVDPVSALVTTADGVVIPSGARTALGAIPAVDLVVVFGVPDGEAELLVAAVTLRPGLALTAPDLDRALAQLPAEHRPSYVQAVRSIPVTTWHRPVWRTLRRAGIPKPTRARKVWQLNDDRSGYTELKPSR